MINLATKYSEKIAEKFIKTSYLQGNTSTDFTWDGAKSIVIYTPQTVGLNDYVRSGSNRFGSPIEMQDEIQTLTLTQDKGFSITIDNGNNSDQMMVKNAGKMLNRQLSEQVVPYMDKYAFDAFCKNGGCIAGISTAPTKSTIVEMIFDGAAELDINLVPDENRVLYLPTKYYNMLRLSPEFVGVDHLAESALARGIVGKVADMTCVKVPDTYLPENVYFLITHKSSVIVPNKLKTARILKQVAGIDGSVLEGRNYFDAFVLGAKACGIYVAVDADYVLAKPTVSVSSLVATVTAPTSATCKYTTDGSDPRYSSTAVIYTSAVTLGTDETIRVYAFKDGMYNSEVVEA